METPAISFRYATHIVEGGSESSDFVVAVNIDVLIEIARVADFTGDGDEVGQGFRDGPGRIDRDETSRQNREKSSESGYPSTESAHSTSGCGRFLKELR